MEVDGLDYRALRSYARQLEFRLQLAKQTIEQFRSTFKGMAHTLPKGWDLLKEVRERDESVKDWLNQVENHASTCSKFADEDDSVTAEEKGEKT